MKKHLKRLFGATMATALLGTTLVGCGNETASGSDTTKGNSKGPTITTICILDALKPTYPLCK